MLRVSASSRARSASLRSLPAALRALQLGQPDLLGQRPQRGDGGHHLERRQPASELARLLGARSPAPGATRPPGGAIVRRTASSRSSMWSSVTPSSSAGRGLDVAGHGEVDQHPPAGRHVGGPTAPLGRGGRADTTTSAAATARAELGHRHRLAAEPGRRALGRARGCGWRPGSSAAPRAAQVDRRQLCDLAGTDHQHRRLVEAAQPLPRQLGGDRGHRGAAARRWPSRGGSACRPRSAASNRRLETGPVEPPSPRPRGRRGSGTRIWASPGTSESSPPATAKRCSAAASSGVDVEQWRRARRPRRRQ